MEGLTNDALWHVFSYCLKQGTCLHDDPRKICCLDFQYDTKDDEIVRYTNGCESDIARRLSLVCKRWRRVVQRYTSRISIGGEMKLRNKKRLYKVGRFGRRGRFYERETGRFSFISLK